MRSVVLSTVLAIENIKFEVFLVYILALIAILLQVVSLHAADSSSSSLARPASIQNGQPLMAAAEEEPAPEVNQASATVPEEPEQAEITKKVWPMNGRVTVEFGVPHRPWQNRHTGIDIISDNRSGAASITPFTDGTVSEIIRSGRGLGNHVIVDHGEGISSVYAHLSRINVRIGQDVKPGDTLGYEGSSGATTGRHLHFEVRVNGVPKNPRNFIFGNPND